jgi:HEAT repeat protein
MPVVLCGMSASFIIGFGAAWHLRAPDPHIDTVTVHAHVHAPAAAASETTGFNQFADLWSKTVSDQATAPAVSLDELWNKAKEVKDPHQAETELQEKLRDMAQADPAALRNLMHRYDSERDPQAREMLKAVLSAIPNPEVLAFSTRLASSSNPAQREDGFELLKQMSASSPEVRNLVLQALATEQAPAVLSQAVAALTPTVVASSEAENIIAQLNNLAQHSDPAVRSQSILQLGQWDKSPHVESRLHQALGDQAPEVRQAAVIALSESGMRSDMTKAALMNIVRNASESAAIKDSALHALERYALDKKEHALYIRTRMELDKLHTH